MKWHPTIVLASLVFLAAAAFAAETDEFRPGEFIPAMPAQPAPEISFADLDGNPVDLDAFRGRLVLVNLWATWCQPCLREMPSLAELQQKLGDGLALLPISEDRGGAKIVEPFIAKLGLDRIKVYLDPKSAVGHAFEVRGLPTSIVIGAKGEMLGRVEGAAEWDSPKLLGIIRSLLPPPGEADPPLKRASR